MNILDSTYHNSEEYTEMRGFLFFQLSYQYLQFGQLLCNSRLGYNVTVITQVYDMRK